MIAQAVLPHLEVWQVQGRAIKIANPARRPLCPRTPWRNKQCRSTCYELTPSHVSSLQGPRLWGKRLALCSAVVGCLEGPVRVKSGSPRPCGGMSALAPGADIDERAIVQFCRLWRMASGLSTWQAWLGSRWRRPCGHRRVFHLTETVICFGPLIMREWADAKKGNHWPR